MQFANKILKDKKTSDDSRLLRWIKCHPYWSAFLVGCIYFGIVISWMFTLKTAEIAQGEAVKLVAASAGLIMTSSFALGFVFFVWLYRLLKIKLTDTRSLLLVPMAWLVSEYLRAILFSVTSYGPGGRLGSYWTFGNAGYYLTETPLAYIARFGGLYLLSGTASLLFVASYQSCKKRSLIPLAPVLLTACLLSLLGYNLYATTAGPARTIVAARYASKDIQGTNTAKPHQLLDTLPGNSVNTLVLPEYSEYFKENEAQDAASARRILKRDDGLIIHSTDEAENENSLGHNLLTFQGADSRILNQQPKWFVVPAGEFVPYIYQIILAYAGQEELLRDFNSQRSVESGDRVEQPYKFDGVQYGSLVCSGVVAPDFYNHLARAGANIFTNSASLDSMGISPLFHIESQNMNKLTAIAHAKPFVQSARGGPAYIIDSDGQILGRNNSQNGGIVAESVNIKTVKTIYTILGDWIVFASIAGITMYMICQKHLRKRA